MKKFLSIFLLVAFLFNMSAISNEAYGLTTYRSVTHYHLDLGVIHCWSGDNGATWQNSLEYGKSYPFSMSITFGADIQSVDAAYVLDDPSDFKWFGDDKYTFNTTKYLTDGQTFNNYYNKYSSNSITNIKPSLSGSHTVNLSYTARLKGNNEYDLSNMLNSNQYNYLIDLLGGSTVDEDLARELAAGKNGVASTTKGYMFFVPIVIKYTTIEPVTLNPGEFYADLTVPTKANTNETFQVVDNSAFDKESDFASTQLFYSVDGGPFKSVDGWKGDELGETISQSFPSECSATYKIVTWNIYGDSDTASKTITISDAQQIEGEAVLDLPAYTYEGHPADAEDESTFTVDGVAYSAKRAYAEGVARNSFSATGGTAVKDGPVDAICTWAKKGTYPVNLNIRTKNGDRLSDTKSIEVRKTPSLEDTLGGFQKQNRKQILTLNIAIYPDKPIIDYDIRIKDLTTNEMCNLSMDTLQDNGACIKTRTPVVDSSGQYWERITVEFLTKYPSYSLTGSSPRKFSYYAKVTDSKGDTDDVYKEFNVVPDIPPIPAISMQDSFLREAGTNTAVIEAADESKSDGDQLDRTWLVANHSPLTGLAVGQKNPSASIPQNSYINATLIDGYENLAFGTNQSIGFNKMGVGKTTVKLHVKDIWIEPTLEEYITPADYLEAETTARTEVINIAPVVSIEPLNTLKANLSILVSKNQLDALKNQSNKIKADLLQKGIDGNLSFIPVVDTYDGGLADDGKSISPDGAACLGQSVSTSDFSYVMQATSVTATTNQTTANNVKIVAYDKAGNQSWNYAFAEHPISHNLYVDNQEKYLLCTGTQADGTAYTLIFVAKTGALLSKLNGVSIPTGSKLFLSNDEKRLYLFNSSGIQKIDFKSGKYTTVIAGNFCIPRLVDGKVGYVQQIGHMKFSFGKFDLSSEMSEKTILPTVNFFDDSMANDNGASSVSPIDWSNDGKVLVARRLCSYGDSDGGQAWVLDASTQKQCYVSRPVGDDKGWEAFLVKDKDGNAPYFTVSYGHQGTTQYYSTFNIYKTICNDTAAENVSYWDSGKQGSVKIPNAGTLQDGKITLIGEQYYGKCWVYNVATNSYEQANTSISVLGYDPIFGSPNYYDGGLVSHYYDMGWNGNGSFYDIIRYKTAITSSQSAYTGIITKADLGDGDNYIVNYGLGDIPKVEALASQKNALLLSIENGVDEIADKIEELGKAPQYVLNLLGNGISNVGSIFKNINLDPNATYEYSYNLQTVSGSAVDVFSENHTNTINTSGTTYYKEPVYKADLTSGESSDITNGFVSYEAGYWFNASDWGVAGYGGGQYSKKNSSGGPVISFTMAQNGYVELQMSGYGERSISLDGNVLYNSADEKYLMLIPSGKHSLSVSANDSDYQSVIKNIEIGYLTTTDNSFSRSTVSSNANGEQTVIGTFKAGKEVAYTEEQSSDFAALNLYDVLNKGYLTFYEQTNNSNSISADGRNATATYYGRTPNSGKITTKMYAHFQAPADKMLWVNYGAYHKVLQPSESVNLSYSSQGYHVYSTTFIANFYAIEIPIGTMGITSSSAISFGTTSNCVPNYTIKNRNSYFYNVTFPTSTTARITKCLSGADNSKSTISFTTANSNSLFNALVSNFVLKARYPSYNVNGTYFSDGFCSLNDLSLNRWSKSITGTGNAEIKLVEPTEKEEDTALVYQKGQLVSYKINYSDFEQDPSKTDYWIYAHTPYNDGANSDAGILLDEDGNVVSVCGQTITAGAMSIDDAVNLAKSKGTKTLTAPIDRFYTDGKYTVYHWEYDDTSRGSVAGGYPNYDKSSNMADVSFYVEGGASAPWITGISTSPSKVTENDYFSINIGIDDAEKNILNLTTEVYRDNKLLFTHRKKNIYPIDTNGNTTTNAAIAIGYPTTNTGAVPDKAQVGKYQVVATVRDQTGAGIGTYTFTVVSEGKITGYVNHTEQWEENRKKYNVSWFGEEINHSYTYSEYMALSLPRKRGINIFWGGEKFVLRAAVAGNPTNVTAKIEGYSYSASMTNSATKNSEGETIYTGSLWSEEMMHIWGTKTPEPLTFTFTATYSGGMSKTHKTSIVVDNMNPYWKLHRTY